MKNPTSKDNLPLRRPGPLILVFLLLSGSCGLIYEIVWMKMLTLVIGNTVFAITTVLTAFMGGLTLGRLVIARFIDRRKNLVLGLALVQGIIGLSALLIVPVLGQLPLLV